MTVIYMKETERLNKVCYAGPGGKCDHYDICLENLMNEEDRGCFCSALMALAELAVMLKGMVD